MIRIQLRRPSRVDPQGFEILAVLTVEGRDDHVEGPRADLIDFSRSVMSIKHRRLISFHEDPEEWARSLVGSFRMPDLYAEVIEDDDAYRGPLTSDTVRLREPAVDHVV